MKKLLKVIGITAAATFASGATAMAAEPSCSTRTGASYSFTSDGFASLKARTSLTVVGEPVNWVASLKLQYFNGKWRSIKTAGQEIRDHVRHDGNTVVFKRQRRERGRRLSQILQKHRVRALSRFRINDADGQPVCAKLWNHPLIISVNY